MNIAEAKRKINFTVNGKKWVMNYSGEVLERPEGGEAWIEKELSALAQKQERVTWRGTETIKNPSGGTVEVDIDRYIDMFIGDILEESAKLYPDQEALISFDGKRRHTYKQFNDDTNAFAKFLISIGVKKNEKIALWMANGIESLVTMIGATKAGAVAVPFNTYEKRDKMEMLLEQADITTLVLYKGAKTTEVIELLCEMYPQVQTGEFGKLDIPSAPLLKNVLLVDAGDAYKGVLDYAEALKIGAALPDDDLKARRNEMELEDLALLIYTSGSTGNPKGVMLTHRNLVESVLAQCTKMSLTHEDKMCMQVQLFHTFGCVNSALTSMMMGMPIVLVSRFVPEDTLRMIERERCTAVCGVPTMFIGFIGALKGHESEYDVSSMRTGTVAGAPSPEQMILDIENVMNMKDISVCYGLTETSPLVSGTNKGDSIELKATSVGDVIPGIEIKLIDPVTLEDLPPGEAGEICVKGYPVMKGYYKNPEETEKAFIGDGWMRTGDKGSFLPNGYLKIGDRLKDVIIRSGENISPAEVEAVIETHPDVVKAYAIGVKDYKAGEIVGIFVKLNEGSTLEPKELRAYCVGKLQTLKIPSYIWFVEEFPELANGKVAKPELRKMAEDMKETTEKV